MSQRLRISEPTEVKRVYLQSRHHDPPYFFFKRQSDSLNGCASRGPDHVYLSNMNELAKPKMRWWVRALVRALILSAVWFALVVATGYIHTDVILAGKITAAEDAAISSLYGEVFGFGVVVLWVLCFVLAKRSQ